MPGIDRTTEFRHLLTEKQNAIPETKRRKITKGSHDGPGPDGSQENILGKEYLAEAYIIVRPLPTMTCSIQLILFIVS